MSVRTIFVLQYYSIYIISIGNDQQASCPMAPGPQDINRVQLMLSLGNSFFFSLPFPFYPFALYCTDCCFFLGGLFLSNQSNYIKPIKSTQHQVKKERQKRQKKERWRRSPHWGRVGARQCWYLRGAIIHTCASLPFIGIVSGLDSPPLLFCYYVFFPFQTLFRLYYSHIPRPNVNSQIIPRSCRASLDHHHDSLISDSPATRLVASLRHNRI